VRSKLGFFYAPEAMAKLTLIKARKILGKIAEGISDAQLEQEIQSAELLKTLYFNQLRKKQVEKSYNKK
jgi:hypothetical protein